MSLSPEKHDGSTSRTAKSIVGTIRLRSGDNKTSGPLKESPKSLKEKFQELEKMNVRTIFLSQAQLNQTPWLFRLPNGELFYNKIPIKMGKPGYMLPNGDIKPLWGVLYADGHIAVLEDGTKENF